MATDTAAMEEVPSSEFATADYDARDLVQRYRKRVPLPRLQAALRAHHATTRRELVELINEKYADFVSLSSRMQGVERALKPLRAPLEESSELTKSLHSRLGGLLDTAEGLHRQLESVQGRREHLKTYIENARLLAKVKKAASQRIANPQESDDATRQHTLQENIARDVRRIRLNLGSTHDAPVAAGVTGTTPSEQVPEGTSPECQALLSETLEFEKTFADDLGKRLRELVAAAKGAWGRHGQGEGRTEALAPNPPSRNDMLATACVCRALMTLGRAAAVEAVFSEVFVQPVLEAAAAHANSSAAGSGAGAPVPASLGGANLGPFFGAVAEGLLAESAPLMWMVRRLCSHPRPEEAAERAGKSAAGEVPGTDELDVALMSVPSMQLLSNAAAAPSLSYVQRVWPNVFTPVFPDVFVANYMHSMRFIADLQAAMPAMERQTFSQSSALKEFRAGWKTQVYYTLRSTDVTKRLEATLAKASASPAGEGWVGAAGGAKPHVVAGRSFHAEAPAELFRMLQQVWSDGWYLETLFPKMVQLSLELLARYARALRTMAKGASELAPAGATSAWDVASGWSSTSLPMRLSRAAADALEIIALTQPPERLAGDPKDGAGEWLASLALRRAPGGADGRPWSITQTLLAEAVVGLRPGYDELLDAMLSQVSFVVTPQFAAIASVPSMFRFLNKPVPTKVSAYVESAMKPIRGFRDAVSASLPADAVTDVVGRAVDAAAVEFATQVTQLLESLQKQMASLQRLAGRGDSQVTDLDKIHVQLCLDTEMFTSMATEMGVVASKSHGLGKLGEAVKPIRSTYESHRARPAS